MKLTAKHQHVARRRNRFPSRTVAEFQTTEKSDAIEVVRSSPRTRAASIIANKTRSAKAASPTLDASARTASLTLGASALVRAREQARAIACRHCIETASAYFRRLLRSVVACPAKVAAMPGSVRFCQLVQPDATCSISLPMRNAATASQAAFSLSAMPRPNMASARATAWRSRSRPICSSGFRRAPPRDFDDFGGFAFRGRPRLAPGIRFVMAAARSRRTSWRWIWSRRTNPTPSSVVDAFREDRRADTPPRFRRR